MAVKEADLGTGRTGGREATTGVIPGRVALSVGCPDLEPPKGWKWTSLSSVAQLESGHTPSRKHPEYWDGRIPWIGIKDATENHGRTLSDTYQHVSALGLENSSARLLPANTVCLSRTASVGFVVVMGRPMATSQDFVNWVCGPNIEAHYLKYVLLAENEALWRFASGTTHQTIYYPEAKAFHVCLPHLAEQKAIAAVLGALDDKIELNRRMNATLEAMARALFQSWFVDFDPVRAKLDGRQPEGMNAETAALFPDSFEDSQLGKIPLGWSVTDIGTFAISHDARREPVKENQRKPGPYPYYGASGIVDYVDGYLFDGEFLLVAEDGENLRTRKTPVAFRAIGQFWVNNHAHVITGPTLGGTRFLMLTLERTDIGGFLTGSTIPKLSQQSMNRISFVSPSDKLLDVFQDVTSPLFERIDRNEHNSKVLGTLRDTLLPKLLSGELSVTGADRAVEAAT
jgi:type I restriction enzyme S subunit